MSDLISLTAVASDMSDEVVDAFSELHPHIRMNRAEWADLREMIEREICGRFGDHPEMSASDLLKTEPK